MWQITEKLISATTVSSIIRKYTTVNITSFFSKMVPFRFCGFSWETWVKLLSVRDSLRNLLQVSSSPVVIEWYRINTAAGKKRSNPIDASGVLSFHSSQEAGLLWRHEATTQPSFSWSVMSTLQLQHWYLSSFGGGWCLQYWLSTPWKSNNHSACRKCAILSTLTSHKLDPL